MRYPVAIVGTTGLILGIVCVFLAVPCPAVDDAFYKSPAAEWVQSGHFAIPCATGFLPQMENVFACYPPVFQIVLAVWYAAFGVSLRTSIAFAFAVHLLHSVLITLVARTLLARFGELGRFRLRSAKWFATLIGIIHLGNLAYFDRLEELALVFFWTGWLLTAKRSHQSWMATVLLQGLCLGAAGLTSPWVGLLGAVVVVFREGLGAVRVSKSTRGGAPHPFVRLRNIAAIGVVSLSMALVWFYCLDSVYPGAINDQFLGTMRHLNRTQQRGDWMEQLERLAGSFLHSPGQIPATALTVTGLIMVAIRGGVHRASMPRELWALTMAGGIGFVVASYLRPEAYTYLGAVQMLWLPGLGVVLLGFVAEKISDLRYDVAGSDPNRVWLALFLTIGCVLFAARDVVVTVSDGASLEALEQPDRVIDRLRQIIPASARVAATARHWNAFQGRNDWREAFFSSLESPLEVLECEWLVLPKDCGTPDFLDKFQVVERIQSEFPSHHTYAYDLYRRCPPAVPSEKPVESVDASPVDRPFD